MLGLLLGACAKRPVLYPNEHLQEVGEDVSKQDIQECMTLADNANLEDDRALEAGKRTAGGAAIGGATGAATGAISGRPGMGAAIGAVTGAMGGFFSWLFGSSEPDPIYKRYVDICLRDRGYQPLGWK
jgi:hypothetical protein